MPSDDRARDARRRRRVQFALAGLSFAILGVALLMNQDRVMEGPTEWIIRPGRGLHRMDVIMLVLALLPWIGILAGAVWPRGRR